MVRKLFILLILLFSGLKSYQQHPNINQVWALGYLCCSNPLLYGMNMDFSSGSLQIDTLERHMNFMTTNAQFFDENKRLLFYSNGIYVANSLDDTMLNGGGLNPSLYTTIRSDSPATGATSGLLLIQGNLVIPFPEDSTKYYLFHKTIDDYNNTYATFYFYYCNFLQGKTPGGRKQI